MITEAIGLRLNILEKTIRFHCGTGRCMNAFVSQLNWYLVLLMKTGEEYAYPPQLFEVVKEDMKEDMEA